MEIKEMYDQLLSTVVDEIDPKLDAGTESAGKRKVTNDLVESTEPNWKPVADHIITGMQEMTDEQIAGVFYGLIRAITPTFKERADGYISSLAENMPKSEDIPSDEEKKELAATRSDLVKQIRTLVDMAKVFKEDWAENATIPPRRGSVGKRGKRALSFYDWNVDGVDADEDSNSVKGISELLGFAKQADFTKALKEQRVVIEGKEVALNTTNPPESFTVTINGKTVTATRANDEEDDDDEVSTEPDSDD